MRTFYTSVFVILVSIPILSAQSFKASFDLVVVQQSPGGNVRNDTVSYYFSDDKTAVVIHGRNNDPGIRMVFNTSDSTITSLFEMNGKKGGFIFPMDEKHWPGLAQSVEPDRKNATSEADFTGNNKEINGFMCHEVQAESEEYSATLWVTDEIPLSMTRVLSYQSVGKGKSKKEVELFKKFGVHNLPMEMFLESKQGKSNVSLFIKNFSESVDTAVFSSDGHTVSEVE